MRHLVLLTFGSLVFISCANNASSDQRISNLEQRVRNLEDRLIPVQNPVSDNSTPNPVTKKKRAIPVPANTYQSSPEYNEPVPRKESSYSERCMATTKKGTRCKRTARSGGYCWQHGG